MKNREEQAMALLDEAYSHLAVLLDDARQDHHLSNYWIALEEANDAFGEVFLALSRAEDASKEVVPE